MRAREFRGWMQKIPGLARAVLILSAMAALGATAPYYMPIEPGAFSEYQSLTTIKLPFGFEVIRRATVRLSIEKSEARNDDNFVWVKIDTRAGEETFTVAALVKSSALSSLPAVSDDLEPFAEVLENIRATELWLNGNLIRKQEEVAMSDFRRALGILRSFLSLKASPAGKSRVDTPLGKMPCEWHEIAANAASPGGLKTEGAKMEFIGKFCLSREVPFRFVKSIYNFKVVVRSFKGKHITLEGHHEGSLVDYGPRAATATVFPPSLLP